MYDAYLPTSGLPLTKDPRNRINFQQPKAQIDPSVAMDQISQFFTDYGLQVIKDLTGIDLSSWEALTQSLAAQSSAAQQFVESLLAQLVALLNPLLGIEEQQNLLAAGAFADAAALAVGTGWSWDGTTGKTANGSAKATASGITMGLLSNEIAVAEGQILALSVWLKWSGVTASGQAFKLDINKYNGTALTGTTTIAFTNNPATNQASWQQLSGSYTIPADVTSVKVRLVVQNTSAGSVWFDDATATKTTLLQQQAQELQDAANANSAAFATLLNSWWTTITTPAQTWRDLLAALDSAWETYVETNSDIVADEWATITDIINGILGVNPDNGLISPGKVEGLGDSWTHIGAALSGDVTNAGDWAWLAQIMITWFGVSSTAHTMAVDNTNTLGIRNNVPAYVGLDNTSESNMPHTGVDFSTAVTATINSTTTSVIGLVRCQHDDIKGAISFLAARPAGALYVNAYKLDQSTNDLIYLWSSADIRLLVPTTKDWARYVFTGGDEIPVDPGDVLAFEFQHAATSGTMAIYGQASGLPNHPSAILKNVGGTRAAPGTSPPSADVDSADWVFGAAAPYVAVEIVGTAGQTYPPLQYAYTTPGVTTQDIAAWAQFVDLIALGDGGGGEGELGFATGYGGTGGEWATTTLEVGVDIKAESTLTITVGPGGAGGPYFTAGDDGDGTTIEYIAPDDSPHTLTAAGGFGGNHAFGMSHNTLGAGLAPDPQNTTYEGVTYLGGAIQLLNYPGYPGNTPGGGGAGGQPFQYGAAGARGQAWTVERQT